MPISVYPERMDKLDPEDVNASLRTIETYIHYICERTEYAITNTFRTTNGLGSSAEAISLVLQEAVDNLSSLTGEVGALASAVNGKVDKVEGMGLSANDYTNAEKDKLAGIDADAEANVIETVKVNGTALPVSGKAVDVTVPAKTSDLSNDSGFLTQETDPTVPAWAKASNKPSYTAQEVGALPDSTVIPSKTSDLTNDSGYQNAQQVQAAAEEAVSGVLSEVSLFDLAPEVFPVEQNGISINTGSNLRTADLIRNYVSSEGHNLSGSTFRSLCLTSGRVATSSATSAAFTLYKSDFKTIPPAATTAKLLLTIRRYRADVGASDSTPQIYAATYDADGKIWWANISTTVLGYYRQRYVVDPQVFSNGNLCIFVQFRKPTHTLKATFDLDVVAADAPVEGATSYAVLTNSGKTVQEQT